MVDNSPKNRLLPVSPGAVRRFSIAQHARPAFCDPTVQLNHSAIRSIALRCADSFPPPPPEVTRAPAAPSESLPFAMDPIESGYFYEPRMHQQRSVLVPRTHAGYIRPDGRTVFPFLTQQSAAGGSSALSSRSRRMGLSDAELMPPPREIPPLRIVKAPKDPRPALVDTATERTFGPKELMLGETDNHISADHNSPFNTQMDGTERNKASPEISATPNHLGRRERNKLFRAGKDPVSIAPAGAQSLQYSVWANNPSAVLTWSSVTSQAVSAGGEPAPFLDVLRPRDELEPQEWAPPIVSRTRDTITGETQDIVEFVEDKRQIGAHHADLGAQDVAPFATQEAREIIESGVQEGISVDSSETQDPNTFAAHNIQREDPCATASTRIQVVHSAPSSSHMQIDSSIPSPVREKMRSITAEDDRMQVDLYVEESTRYGSMNIDSAYRGYKADSHTSIGRLLDDLSKLSVEETNAPATKGDLACLYKFLQEQERQRVNPPNKSATSDNGSDADSEQSEPSDAEDGEEEKCSAARTRKGVIPKHRAGWRVQLASDVRIYTRQLMGRKNRASPFPPVPSKRELEDFILQHRGGPTPSNFRVDVSGTGMRSEWNREAAKIFTHQYVQLPDAVTKDKRVVVEAFLSHIPALCRQYKKRNPGKTLDPDAESANVRRVRRNQLGIRRFQVMSLHPQLQEHSAWINLLGTDGNSGDESDHRAGQMQYVIKSLPWRSQMLTEYLRALDVLHISTKFSSTGKAKKGAWPRIRVEGRRRVDYDSPVVPGLPSNFYDPEWLATQNAWKVDALEIQEFDVDLTLPFPIKSIVDRFKHVKGPHTPPLALHTVLE